MVIRRALVVGLAVGALVLAGCKSDNSGDGGGDSGGGSGAGSGFRIDVITHANEGDSFWDVVKAGAEQAAEDTGVDMHYSNNGDPGEQSTLIDNAVAANTDGLVISMADPPALEDSIKAAVAAGIPVITINSGIDSWQDFGAITHVGQSETLAGKAAGEQLTAAGLTNVICVIQEAGNVGLEQRCAGAKSTFSGNMQNLQADTADLQGSQSTIEAKLQQDDSIDGILTLGGDMAGAAVAAVDTVGRDVTIGTFDLNATVAQDVLDGNVLFAVDQQPYVQGYLGVIGIYLKLLNGNDIGGGQPVYSGPAIITKDNAEAVLKYAKNGTR
jgi:simple sugar transport system substrate-binding protein